MSCRSFEDLVERCFEVKQKPELLGKLRKESVTVQRNLLKETGSAEEAIGRFIEERLPTICIVVSAALLAKDQIYFEAVQCAASAVSGVSRVSMCAYGESPMTIHDYEFKGGRHVNEFWNAASAAELDDWTKRRGAWLMLMLTIDAELAERIHGDGFGGWPSQILYFRDLCAYAAQSIDRGRSASPLFCRDVGGRPAEKEGEVSIWHLRWLPWSLSFAGGLVHHVVSDRGVLLARSRATSNALLQSLLDVVSLDPLDAGVMGVPDFVRMLLTSRVRPRFVVDDTGYAPEYRLILEMLYLNGVPILSTSEDDRSFIYGGGIADWRISSLVADGEEQLVARRAPGWRQSGWDDLKKLIVSMESSP